jgi:hypothetical protein
VSGAAVRYIFAILPDPVAAHDVLSETNVAPIVGMGHSAAASMTYYLAVWNPERTLAAISISGQWPYARGQFAPDIWGDRTGLHPGAGNDG